MPRSHLPPVPLVGDVRGVPVEILTFKRIEKGSCQVALGDGAPVWERVRVDSVRASGSSVDEAGRAQRDPVDVGRLAEDRFHVPMSS